MSGILVIPDEHPDKFLDMPEGLDGYWWETEHLVCVPSVASKREGSGIFSNWLNELEAKGKTVLFPTIISARLDAILRSRGYVDAGVNDEYLGFVDGLAKEAKCNHTTKIKK